MDAVRKVIDWEKTGVNLKLLRIDNIDLRRFSCRELSLREVRGHDCDALDCESCRFKMDNNISQYELGLIFSASADMVANWETGRTVPELEDLLFYSEISKVGLFDIIVFDEPKSSPKFRK